MIKVGALWFKTSKKGTQFFSGILDMDKMPAGDKVNVVVFRNDRATSAKAPTHIMYLSEPPGGGSGYGAQRKPTKEDFFGGGQEEIGDGTVPDEDTPF